MYHVWSTGSGWSRLRIIQSNLKLNVRRRRLLVLVVLLNMLHVMPVVQTYTLRVQVVEGHRYPKLDEGDGH